MLLNLLNAVTYVGVGDAALYALIGFIVVFIGIAFLVVVVWAVGKILNSITTKADTKMVKTSLAEKPIEVADTANNNDEISEETIAVIMAALTAYYQTNQPKCEFTVKRIKRI